MLACDAPEVDPTSVAEGRATAEVVGEKAAATAREFVEDQLASGYGIAFDYPVGELDGAGRRQRDRWSVLQEYAAENDWVGVCTTLPDCRHAGVDFHVRGDATGRDTASEEVYPIAPGRIIAIHTRAGDGYPGQAILIEHETDQGPIYSMYGHIHVSAGLGVEPQQNQVDRNRVLGTIILWPDHFPLGNSNSHLHFEIRTFGAFPEHLESRPVTDRDAFPCNSCAVGPGYWLESEGGPAALGWLDPIQVIEDSRR